MVLGFVGSISMSNGLALKCNEWVNFGRDGSKIIKSVEEDFLGSETAPINFIEA